MPYNIVINWHYVFKITADRKGAERMYPVKGLANYIVAKCIRDKQPIPNISLQQILYMIQREFLRLKGEPAFSECIVAWDFGAVVPEAYYYFCGAGAMPISICDMEKIPNIDERDKRIIDRLLESKRGLTYWDLSLEIKRKGGAWDMTYRNGAGNEAVIPVKAIKEYG